MSDVDLNLASDWRRIDDDDTEEIVSPKKMLKDFRPDHSHKDQPTVLSTLILFIKKFSLSMYLFTRLLMVEI